MSSYGIHHRLDPVLFDSCVYLFIALLPDLLLTLLLSQSKIDFQLVNA